MAYVALYRKFRPDTFDEVKGQDTIVTTLKNQIKHNRIGHAYLFCGTRGTGKTSVAKLMAKAVNCESPVDGSPCGTCDSCRRIASGAAMNVLEIDAASNNGVGNIRQLNEGVQYAPTDGKYMVYIIDEVHMLTDGAFNAMLKTLEEPPSYVIFILATTESHRVPVTIRSRCQRYDFKRIEYTTIADRMEDLMQREAVSADREALEYIARAADGSMRDALSILDECVSFNLGETLTLDRVLKTIGAVDTEIFEKLTDAIAADDPVAVMQLIHEVVWKGMDLTRFVDDYVWFLRNMLFLALSPGLGSRLDMTEEQVALLVELGKEFSRETLERQLHLMQELSQEIRYSSAKRVTLEMGMIRLMRPEMRSDSESLIGRIERLEKRAGDAEAEVFRLKERLEKLQEGGVTIQKVTAPKEPQEELHVTEEEREEEIRKRFSPATAEDLLAIRDKWWKEIIPQLPETATKRYLSRPQDFRYAVYPKTPENGSGEGEPVLEIRFIGDPKLDRALNVAMSHLEQGQQIENLCSDIEKITGIRVKVKYSSEDVMQRETALSDLASKIKYEIEEK